ncbi:MAG: histidine phosphatase family protein [Nocardioides sp.]|jgi:broad specificity phosphatase PhoE
MGRILVVRHGQASFGADDYDVLSPLGERQAAITGEFVREFAPDVVIHGTMRRQRDTALLAAQAAEWRAPLEVDAAWNEMDHLNVLSRLAAPSTPTREAFQAHFNEATERWQSGEFDDEYDETFAAFWSRCLEALERATAYERAVVVTSGGPIAVLATHLIAGDLTTYQRLCPVIVNASVTRVLTGSTGQTLLSFNEHAQFGDQTRTYR